MMQNKTINVTKPTLPVGGGAIRGIGEKFQPNEFTGTASLSIPIPTSPSRGFEPHLSLEYSSGSGNGPFGMGFSLAIPNISRKTSKAIPKYDETDSFILSNADDLVLVENSQRHIKKDSISYSISIYRPRTEGLFARIEKWVNLGDGTIHWREISNDNVTSIYGQNHEARIVDPENKTHIFQWLIERVYEPKGNQIVYEYLEDQGNKYIRRIKYGNFHPDTKPASEDWHFEVGFEYSRSATKENLQAGQGKSSEQVRPDPFTSYKSGFRLHTARRCVRISMSHRFEGIAKGVPYEVSATYFEYEKNSIQSLLKSITHVGYSEGNQKAMPPLEFTWSTFDLEKNPAAPSSNFRSLKIDSNLAIPGFLQKSTHQIVDLYGEGIPGILYSNANTVLYSRPLGNGNYSTATPPYTFPIERDLQDEHNTLMDLGGDGKLDLVVTTQSRSGYYESRRDGSWEPYRNFVSIPTELHHSQKQMVDVTGDGLTDLLLFEDHIVKVYSSRGRLGYDGSFGQDLAAPLPVTSNPFQQEVVRFVDLFGDGGSHLVRIRNGSVECWPNLGYGRFGQKIEIENAPRFDADLDASRLFFADIDGTGSTDLIYAFPDRIDVFRNQSGNRFSEPISIPLPSSWNDLSQISFADILGNGTECLVVTGIRTDLSLNHWYYDFTGGMKPYLLTRVDNNMGATTIIHFSSSTKFYLADEKNGTPWITRLPFPVHVVEMTETIDQIGGSRLATSYTYHHGYYDPIDREFRGFGRVDRLDAETLNFSHANTPVQAFDVPPVLTKTWYHTGAYAESELVSQKYRVEYYQGDDLATPLADSTLDAIFLERVENIPEAYRALHGHILREEVYGLDHKQNPNRKKPDLDQHPYTVTESNFHVRLIQPKTSQPYAVCLVHPRETISYHYERNPVDPRMSHKMILEVDLFGTVTREITIGYGRRQQDRELLSAEQEKQTLSLVTYNEKSVMTNFIDELDNYRTPIPVDVQTFELTGFTPENKFDRFNVEDFAQLNTVPEIPYEQTANRTFKQKRLIERIRTVFRKDDLTGFLPLGQIESLALPGESYHLAFTPELLSKVYVRNDQTLVGNPSNVLENGGPNHGGYVDLEGNGHWWMPSGSVLLSPDENDDDLKERSYARQHFFVPCRTRDPFYTKLFNTDNYIYYDAYDLLIVETRDAMGNRVKFENDYYTLQPRMMTDPNGNRTAVAFDALGMVIASALMGKESERVGDILEGLDVNLTTTKIQAFMADPHAQASSLLGKATTRIIYDVDRFQRVGQPPFAAILARDTHVSDLAAPQNLRIHISFMYSDGFGRAVQSKAQVEAGEAPTRVSNILLPSGDVSPGQLIMDNGKPKLSIATPRWVGTGRMVYNNKGLPVKQYEPFFSSTHLHETEEDMTDTGVSPVIFYDSLERVIATLHPNNTFEKVVFGSWQQTTWDANDTVALDPRVDADINGFTAGYFNTQPAGWQTWLQQRGIDPENPPNDTSTLTTEKRAAVRTLSHAGTPAITYFDVLARAFLTIADNGRDVKHRTLVEYDIEGNHRELIDAAGRITMRYGYDIVGNRIHEASMDAGERWVLKDVMGNPLYSWDSRKYQLRTTYDLLRRPLESYLSEVNGREFLVERTIYGENLPQAETRNLRGRIAQRFDSAGMTTREQYDFKGNLLVSTRKLVKDYKDIPDWSQNANQLLEDERFISSTRYDGFNRPIQVIAPHSANANSKLNIIQPGYGDSHSLIRVDAWLEQSAEPSKMLSPATADLRAVTKIEYDAKGQRTQISYGNGVQTTYTYDALTYHLVHLQTLRGKEPLQDLRFTFDPVGNIIHIQDDAQQTVYFNGQVVRPQYDYMYDAMYRLVNATGREHIGQLPQLQGTWKDEFRINLLQPGDGRAMRTYTEQYVYDIAGNFEKMIHQSANGSWTRSYIHKEPSLLEPEKTNNRLTSTTVGSGLPEIYTYDMHGNMTRMPHLPLMQWDYRNQFQASSQQVTNEGTAETTWYVYDGSGQRVRKVTERQAAAGRVGTRKSERIYLGGFEIYREYGGDGHTPTFERETLHVMDDERSVALIETRTKGQDKSQQQMIRYQFDNHLGSANLELDNKGQVISYEEYTPFGSTSYQAVRSQTETPKRYRYSGKERDDSTGFYYYGARYYAPWLGYWTSSDPARTVDGLNLYRFVNNNPSTKYDIHGYCGNSNKKKRPRKDEVDESNIVTSSRKKQDINYKPMLQSNGYKPPKDPNTEYPEYPHSKLPADIQSLQVDRMDFKSNATQDLIDDSQRRDKKYRTDEDQRMINDPALGLQDAGISRNHKLAYSSTIAIVKDIYQSLKSKNKNLKKPAIKFFKALTGNKKDSEDLYKQMEHIAKLSDKRKIGELLEQVTEVLANNPRNLRFGDAELNQRILYAWDPNVRPSGKETPRSEEIHNSGLALRTVLTQELIDNAFTRAFDKLNKKPLSSSMTFQ